MISSDIAKKVSYKEFLSSFNESVKRVFYESDNIEKFILNRGFPALVLRDIMATKPLSVAIPKEFGGRGTNAKECLGLLDAAAYESLPLSLAFGINIALFMEPVAKYGQASVKADIFNRFLNHQHMGGLMITEPDYGSDALNMQTYNVKKGSNYHIKGTKHWQGLTGMADYWLMTSRNMNESGNLGRDIDFFIVDVHQTNQAIQVEQYYNNAGLYPIPYGKNSIDILVPGDYKIEPESSGIKILMELFYRSRLQFSGMGMGFIRRLLDEALEHVTNRFVGGRPLMALDQVQHQVSEIQSAFTISSAMISRSAEISGIENDLEDAGVEASSVKAYISDLMQKSAQTLTQLKGSAGYKLESVAARGIMDSRPFQIFEGSNEMLYTQISETVVKKMVRQKTMQLSEFLKSYDITQNASDYFKSFLDFTIDIKMPQRKSVDLGKIISRVISANQIINLGTKGFKIELIRDSLESIKHEISMLVSSFKYPSKLVPIVDYREDSNWLEF
ncbi:MAG: acyl-CoA/acyl-ACP dehydrogenase [Bacteroidales bacterium]|nr:acyl-CoA/acyl-ACP dehydrogenase [Bacteroidales bacterium]MCF8390894.1 acyl-CoA/acyl-ACP dehydrogenase [Bacteroidales bacterium]